MPDIAVFNNNDNASWADIFVGHKGINSATSKQ